jgi:hypothetical protein
MVAVAHSRDGIAHCHTRSTYICGLNRWFGPAQHATGWHLAVSGVFLQEKVVDLKRHYFFNIPLQPSQTSLASTNTSQSEPTTTSIMNPAAAAQEDASTLSSHDTNPVKLRWSKMKPEEKRPIQEVFSQKIWPIWKLIGDSGEDEWQFTHKIFQLMNPTLGTAADAAAEIAWKVRYQKACISCFNATRINFVSQMKDKTEVWWT